MALVQSVELQRMVVASVEVEVVEVVAEVVAEVEVKVGVV